MSEQIKFTEEELNEIKNIRDTNSRIIFNLGEVDLELQLINQRIQELTNLRTAIHSEYNTLQTREKEIVQQLSTKYGVGQVDLESGTFTPN